MSAWLVDSGERPTTVALLMASATLPAVLVGPFAGAFVDRGSRVRVIMRVDVARGVAMSALAAYIWGRAPTSPRVLALCLVAMISGAGLAFFRPALSAALPDLVRDQALPAANSLFQLSVQGTAILGQAAGAVVYQRFGTLVVIAFNGATFLIAGAATRLVRLPPRHPEPIPASPVAPGSFFSETLEGIQYVLRRAGLRNFMMAASAFNFALMPVLVLLPFFAGRTLGAPASWYGFLLTAFSAGLISGYLPQPVSRYRHGRVRPSSCRSSSLYPRPLSCSVNRARCRSRC